MAPRAERLWHAQPARQRHQPLPAPAREQPHRVVGVVRRGLRRSRPPRCARAAVRRVRRLPLVPCHGARVVRGPGDGGPGQRAIRGDQGGPRGAPRHRRRVHGGDAGDDRLGRLADDVLPHAGRGAVPLRHLLPAAAAARDARLPAAPGRRHEGVAGGRRAGSRRGGGDRCAAGRQRRCRAAPRARRRRGARPCCGRAGRGVRPRARGFRRRAEVPPVDGVGVPAAPPRAHRLGRGTAARRAHGGADGPRRDVRPARRRVRPLQRRRSLGRAALREDALRQRPAAAGLRPPRAGHRRGAPAAGRRGDRRVPAPRAPHAGRRFRLGPRRRHRRRRGPDLRVDAAAAARGARTRRRRVGRGAARRHRRGHVRARDVDPAVPARPRRRHAVGTAAR